MAKPQTYSIVLGDTFLVRYKCYRKKDLKSYSGTSEGDPVTPVAATVRLINFEAGQEIPLGITGLAAEAEIEGNVVSFLIPATKLTETGRYRVYTQIKLQNGEIRTPVVLFTVTDLQ